MEKKRRGGKDKGERKKKKRETERENERRGKEGRGGLVLRKLAKICNTSRVQRFECINNYVDSI